MQRYPETPGPTEPPDAADIVLRPDVELSSHSRLPRLDLGVDWGSPWHDFRTSVHDFFRGERAPENFELPADSALRVEWIEGKIPGRAFTASALWHVAIVAVLLLPIWRFLASDPRNLAPVRIELTWTNPAQDLPPISLPGHDPKPSPKGNPAKPLPQKGADAFHPRQTILSQPAVVTHPRQTLIQPDAPPTPPKIEVPLPNIVEWAAPKMPARPRLRVASTDSAPQVQHHAVTDLAAPELVNQEKTPGPLDIAASPTINQQPRMPVEPMSKAVAARRATQAETGAAPEIGAANSAGDDSLHRVIALSAAPAPPAPEVTVPQGNLAARIAISPEGKQPGAPGGADNGSAGNGGSGGNPSSGGGRGTNTASGAGSLPAAVSVNGGNSHAGNGGLAPAGRATTKLNLKPMPALDAPASAHHGPAVIGAIDPKLPPEVILSGKEIYTLHIDMPNLTSVTGNWVMNFAQLEEGNPPYSKPTGKLSGPSLVSKVDPKYPQVQIKEHVDGEVVLYAIIRKDGSVDSIQLVHGIDPQLDKNSMEALARWVFRPATREGQSVELEAVVHIPFKFRRPE
ncbi:MAG TPA: TonB family protein [Candidatus Acidoferrales bacterium]